LGASTDGYVLTTGGAGTVPAWEAAAGGADVGTANTWTADQTFNDDVKVTLGTGGDADIYFDGTDLRIKPGLVTSTNTLKVTAGDNVGMEIQGSTALTMITIAAASEAQDNKTAIYFQAAKDATPGSANSTGAIYSATTNSGGTLTGDMRFSTNSGDSLGENFRIVPDNSGMVLFGKTASHGGTKGVEITTATGYINAIVDNNTIMLMNRINGVGQLMSFRYNSVEKGEITTDGTNTAYNTTSDYRLKENIVDLTGAVTRVKALQPRRFNFLEMPDVTKDGFIAHEASDVVPEAVSGTKDGTKNLSNVVADADGVVIAEGITEDQWVSHKEPQLVSEAVEAVDAVLYVDGDEIPEGKSIGDVKTPAIEAAEAVYGDPAYAADTVWHETLTVPHYQGIDQAKLVPLLTAAIQELTARVEALESA